MGQGIYYHVPSTEDGIFHNPLNLTIIPGVGSFQMRKLKQDRSSSDEDPKQKCSRLPSSEPESVPQGPTGRLWAPPRPLPDPCSQCTWGRSARGRGHIDSCHLPVPELSARSETIGFPLGRSIASTGFQFVFPEIHLPATFLINPPPPHLGHRYITRPGPPLQTTDHEAPRATGELQVCLKLISCFPVTAGADPAGWMPSTLSPAPC